LVAVKAVDITHVPAGLDILEAAAIPLVALTGDQLVREACALQPGQSVLVTGALGSVGRCAVHSALTLGATVIAGVRTSQVEEAKTLGTHGVLAMDDEAAIKTMGTVDAIADTTGERSTMPLLTHVREGGICGTVVTPPPDVSLHPGVRLVRQKAHPDPKRVRDFAQDYHDGKLKLPIVRRYGLHEVVEAHTFAEKGGSGGKILLLVL
jgi:NADPH:quinone reductase-like Zn-dependent oxidoreductase